MICTRCQEDKSPEEFYNCKYSKSGKRSWCKLCGNVAALKWHKDNPDKHSANAQKFQANNPEYFRWRSIERRYGLTQNQWLNLFKSQNYKCAIPKCGRDTPGNDHTGWHIDHDHKTGKIRGILCQPCNMLLGLAKDSPDKLRSCAEYLEKTDA